MAAGANHSRSHHRYVQNNNHPWSQNLLDQWGQNYLVKTDQTKTSP